ncbi:MULTISPECIES: propionyl-CoA synthetase [Dietzia]|jgi:propionyl-CoA synthetase|uniref:propionyl-CoA synthetase n=1 Tax=Dietzia TaxID=37914 RepID=UPI00080514C5|nr:MULTISPECIES: propionyl-CoA synthetase [Dietzia]MBB0995971.1 propionyl-CoA synthetase [Dietzia maris]OAV79213.1 propionate--CoA ligase [Dietzia sp. 111N12-1]HBD21895.1 acetate--CoA ligase [Dietzia sp.]
MSDSTASSYAAAHRLSISDPDAFWLDVAADIDWTTPPTTAVDRSRPPFYRWFPDGELNTSYNCVDRHVEAGRGDQAAFIYDSAVTGVKETITYAQLLDRVEEFAGALAAEGVGRGDRVVIYMPMVPRAAVAMLACARLGAVHSVVFGGFAAPELAIRIDDARPKVIVTSHGGIEPTRKVPYFPMVTKALELTRHTPGAVIVAPRHEQFPDEAFPETPGTTWSYWDDAVAASERAAPVPVKATDPLYILYTSGTTGLPKGVVRDNGGHAVALAWSMWNVYGVRPGEVWWTASDVGWVVGHSYIVYAPLLIGATSIIYEGKPVGTPDAGAFWRVISEHRATALFTAPTAVRAVRREDPEGAEVDKYDLSSLRTLFCAGERLDPDTYQWATDKLGTPVVDNWWQTETGWPIASNLRGLEPMPIKAGSPTVAVPGYDLHVLDGEGNPLPAGEEGNLAIKLPMAPGTLAGLWEDDERFVSSYMSVFDGYYSTGDGGYIDSDGYVYVMGRTDDVINVAGHRLSTGSMEAVIATHPAVAEAAVIGVRDELKGQRPVGYVVLKSGQVRDPEELRAELVAMVRDEIGAVATFRDCTVVQGLPKTRSGKILRKTMRQIADGQQDVVVPSTIEDPAVLDALAPFLRPRK